MIQIQPQYLTLSKLLDGRLFRIPEYQRAYSWGRRQREDLFSDIKRLHAKGADEGHFMAAVVCLRKDQQVLGTDLFHVVEIVDGQQRLTTLIILLRAIALRLDRKDRKENKLADEIDELLVKTEGEELLLLQTNHDTSHHFATFLRTGKAAASATAKTIADRELLGAMEDCLAFVDQWRQNAELPALAALLKNRLHFLLHEIDDEKAVYTVFEVLNSRGLDVSWLDRLKSILMGSAFELENANRAGLINDLHTTWRDIYSVIGLHQGRSTEALRFAATLNAGAAPSRPMGEEESVAALRQQASTGAKIRSVAHWLLRVTRACDVVAANPRIDAVTRISQARLLAVAINLRDDLSDKERATLLASWERVSFRIYGLINKDARTRVGEYVRLAWSVVQEKPSVAAILKEIRAIGVDFGIDEAIGHITDTNCYHGWEASLRYLMFRYEEHLAREQGLNFKNEQWEKIWLVSPSESIEHIWSQKKAPEKHKHRLGNLVLLPPKLNSKLQDSDPDEKASSYRKTGLLIAGAVADQIDADGWKGAVIDSRENALLEWIRKEWAD